MKMYYYYLTGGLLIKTEQYIVFTQEGYSIDKQAVTPEESCIIAEINYKGWNKYTDLIFKSSDIIASWEE